MFLLAVPYLSNENQEIRAEIADLSERMSEDMANLSERPPPPSFCAERSAVAESHAVAPQGDSATTRRMTGMAASR